MTAPVDGLKGSRLDRRTLIRLAGLAGIGLAVPDRAFGAATASANTARYLRRLGQPQDAVRLARRIRLQHDTGRVEAILRRVAQRLTTLELRQATPELRRILRAWIAADFEKDRVLSVDGWILSETEVGLALLTADLHA